MINNIWKDNKVIPKERLQTIIALIMIIEHKKLALDDLIDATGMSFKQVINVMQNLVNIRLVEVIPENRNVPKFQIIDENEAKKYLEIANKNSLII